MKNFFVAVFFILASFSLTAQGMDVPVATVKLFKTTVISQKTFRDQMTLIENSNGRKMTVEEKNRLLDVEIVSELISQAAEKQGIKATDEDVMRQFQAANPGATEQQIKQAFEQRAGVPWDKGLGNLKRQIASQKYLATDPRYADLGKIDVTDREVQDFYDSNKATFVSPDYVRVSHIFFDTKQNPKGTLDEIKRRASDIQKKISLGQATFEEMAYKESDDKQTGLLNGDIGFIPSTSDTPIGQQLTGLFGKDFLSAVFALKKGEVSGVLTSNAGLHIVKVTQKIDHHFLALNEEVYPGKTAKVSDAIKQNLQQRKVSVAQEKLIKDIADSLKKQAEIKTFPQNM